MTAAQIKKPVDKYIPWMFVMFFMTFIMVDAIMVTLAVRTQTGTVTEYAYEKGLDYNRALEAANQQNKWGWQDTITLQGKNITFSLRDQNGKPIKNAAVIAHVTRPVQDGYDFSMNLKQSGNQAYEAVLPFPMPGKWKIRIVATWQNKQYQSSRIVLVP